MRKFTDLDRDSPDQHPVRYIDGSSSLDPSARTLAYLRSRAPKLGIDEPLPYEPPPGVMP